MVEATALCKPRTDFSELYIMDKEVLGSGSNADVYRAECLEECADAQGCGNSKRIVAVKVLHPKDSSKDESEIEELPEEFMREVQILAQVQGHPHLVQMKGLFILRPPVTTGPRWGVVMEYYSGGDLFEEISRSPLSESRAKTIMRGLLSAIAHLHKLEIAHRDVKAENILIDAGGSSILADLGIACRLSNAAEMSRRCGSPGYMAPEVLLHESYDGKVDVFSAGVVLFMCLCGRMPFSGPSLAATLRRTVKQAVDFTVSSLFEKASQECKDFILSLTQKKQGERPTCQEALLLPWLQQASASRNRDAPATMPRRHTDTVAELLRNANYGTGSASSGEAGVGSRAPVPPTGGSSPWRFQHPARRTATPPPKESCSLALGQDGEGQGTPSRAGSFSEALSRSVSAVAGSLAAVGRALSGSFVPGRLGSRKQPVEIAKEDGEEGTASLKLRFRQRRRAARDGGGNGQQSGAGRNDEDNQPDRQDEAMRDDSVVSGCVSFRSSSNPSVSRGELPDHTADTKPANGRD